MRLALASRAGTHNTPHIVFTMIHENAEIHALGSREVKQCTFNQTPDVFTDVSAIPKESRAPIAPTHHQHFLIHAPLPFAHNTIMLHNASQPPFPLPPSTPPPPFPFDSGWCAAAAAHHCSVLFRCSVQQQSPSAHTNVSFNSHPYCVQRFARTSPGMQERILPHRKP